MSEIRTYNGINYSLETLGSDIALQARLAKAAKAVLEKNPYNVAALIVMGDVRSIQTTDSSRDQAYQYYLRAPRAKDTNHHAFIRFGAFNLLQGKIEDASNYFNEAFAKIL